MAAFLPIAHPFILLAFLAMAGLELLLFALLGEAKPSAQWVLLDMAGEGGTAFMAACWMSLVLASRPGGRVTQLLAWGLAAVALGAWADCLDEFFVLSGSLRLDKWLESVLTPAGMLLVTAGIVTWRSEQLQLTQHMQRRERLFREHRAFDRITQLADAHYLRQQMALERSALRPAAMVMLELEGFHELQRRHGRREADRMLQAVTHQLLLNLRNHDLLCRYAGERLAVLLPQASLAEAQRLARHLEQMVALTHFHLGDGSQRVPLRLRSACASLDDAPEAVLSSLNLELEGAPLHPASAQQA